MTTNLDDPALDGPYHAATFVDDDDVRLRLYRTTSTPEVYLTVTDYEAAVAVRFNLNRRNLERLITSLQRESELLAAPKVGERRCAPADDPERAGHEAIRVDDVPRGRLHSRRWFVYRGDNTGQWTTDAEVADWTVIE